MCWLLQSAQLWYLPTFLLPPLAVIAGIECFAGWHVWRFLLGLNGGIVGFVAGAWLCVLLGVPMLVLIGALAGAVAGAALFICLEGLGSFIFAFGSTTSLLIILGRIAGAPPYSLSAVAAVAGVGSAVAALAIRRPAMIAIAAIAGAQQIASAGCAWYLPADRPPIPGIVTPSEVAAFVALAAAGLVTQFVTSRPYGAEPAGHSEKGDTAP